MDNSLKKTEDREEWFAKNSLSRLFSIALTLVVTIVILIFSTIAAFYNNAKIETRLQQKLAKTLKFAETSLPSSVWQLDYDSMGDMLDAVFTDDSIIYVNIVSDDETLAKKTYPKFEHKQLSYFKKSAHFLVDTIDIHKSGQKIGTFNIVMSREKIRKELLYNLFGIALFTVFIIAVISITCIYLTKHYIFDPLLKLEQSTGLIASGNLEESIIIDRDNEIGKLANSILNMRGAIKNKIKELKQAEKKYRDIFDYAIEGIFQCTPGGYFINVNLSAAAILGYDSPEDMITSIKDVTNNLYVDTKEQENSLKTLYKEGKILNLEVQTRCKDKSIIWISINARQIRNSDGKILYYEGSFLDITRRIEAQYALQENLSRYRLLLKASPIPITVYDSQGMVSYVNPVFENTFGWTMDELIGQRIDFVPPHEAEKTGEAVKNTLKGEQISIESQRFTKDKRLLDVLINAALYTDHDGKPAGMIVTFRDFTELKQAERDLSKHRDHLEQMVEERTIELTATNQSLSREILEHKATESALKDSEERFRQLAEMLPETVFEMDLTANFTFRNQASYEMFGYDVEKDTIPINALDSIVQEDHLRVIESCAKILEGNPSGGNEYTAIRKDGSHFPIMIYTNALIKDNEPIGYRGILLDISERKEMEEELRLAKELADEASKTKSEFLANMSHEIRTPMNAILGMGDLLLESDLNMEQQKYAKILCNSGNNLLDIINDILDLSKIEAGQIEMETISVNLQDLFDEICAMLAVRAHSKDLELLCRVKTDTPIHLLGDPARLRQILVNLIGNAIKFTNEGEVILEVTSMETPEPGDAQDKIRLLFSVHDTGIGIPEEKQSHIFDSFAQADSSTTREFGGTGLGLTISKRMVEMMGGQIWLKSEPGHGCTFFFTIDFYLDKNAKPSEKLSEDETVLVQKKSGRQKALKILVVDDGQENRILIQAYLKTTDHKLDMADNGKTGLEKFKSTEYDIVLMDMRMPIMDGYTAAKEIRQWEEAQGKPAVFIVALTAHAMKGDRQKCLDAGCSDYLAKPLKKIDLLKMIEKN